MTFGSSNRVAKSSYNGLLVISVRLNKYEVKRVLIDIGSSINLLTLYVHNKLGLNKNTLTKVSYPLIGL